MPQKKRNLITLSFQNVAKKGEKLKNGKFPNCKKKVFGAETQQNSYFLQDLNVPG